MSKLSNSKQVKEGFLVLNYSVIQIIIVMKKIFLILLLNITNIFCAGSSVLDVILHELNQVYVLEKQAHGDDCVVIFVKDQAGNKYVIKQIRNPDPSQQFLLILDVLGAYIAECLDLPINRVRIISPKQHYCGKIYHDRPAVLCTYAFGITTNEKCMYKGIDIQQRFRRPGSKMWNTWGSLPEEKKGLTKNVICMMSLHKNLPRIVALDTFIGNSDRGCPNLFYDSFSDSFCGIDMAGSFNKDLAKIACTTVDFLDIDLSDEVIQALQSYYETLKTLINSFPRSRIYALLDDFAQHAGFGKDAQMFCQEVAHRIDFHKRMIAKSLESTKILIQKLEVLLSNVSVAD